MAWTLESWIDLIFGTSLRSMDDFGVLPHQVAALQIRQLAKA